MGKKFVHRQSCCQRGHSMADAFIEIDANGYEHRRCQTCRKERLKRWRFENPDKIKTQAAFYADIRIERVWRFRMWENAHLRPEHRDIIKNIMLKSPHIANVRELTSPVFVFELRGKKQKEVLTDPLPEW